MAQRRQFQVRPPELTLYPCIGGAFIKTNLALLPKAKLKKMRSDDGRWNYVEGKAYIGKEYLYSPASRAPMEFWREVDQESFTCECVMVWDEEGFFAPMPVECLDL